MDNCIHGVDARNDCKECNEYEGMVLDLKIAKAKLLKLNEEAADALVAGDRRNPSLIMKILATRQEIAELQPKVEAEAKRCRRPF